jgi:Abnormal spindle-like microcephaly-assoc'd, ASPM-SPD-2-Hydin
MMVLFRASGWWSLRIIQLGLPDVKAAQSPRQGRSLSHRICLIALVISQPACAVLETIDKIEKIPGLEETRARKAQEKRPADTKPSSIAQLQANPPQVRFDSVPVTSQRQQVVVVSNPATFPVTIVDVSVTGCDFAVLRGGSSIVAAESDVTFTVTFQPSQRRTCSGALLIEIDSAGGRFMRIPLRGQAN